MADVLTTASDVSRADMITALVQRQLIAQSKLAATVMDFSAYAVKGQKTVAFPRANNFTVGDKTAGTAVDAQKLTWALDTIALDKHKVIQWIIEDAASVQGVVDLEVDAVKRAVAGMAKQLDLDIYTALAAASSASPDHRVVYANSATDNTLAKADIINAIKLLDLQEVPEENRFIAINPTQKAQIMSLDNFIDASKFGNSDAIQKYQIGELLGLKVVCSTAVTADRTLIYHKEACGFAVQMGTNYESQKDLANLGMRHSVQSLYGVKELQAGKMQVLLGSAT